MKEEEWRHRCRVAEAQAAYYRRKCDHYEWSLRWIRNQQDIPADEYRHMAARTLADAEELE